MKNSGLGRGLDSIFLDNHLPEEAEGGLRTSLRLSDIEPNANQPRKRFDPEALSELAASIKEHGLLQPILVRQLPSGYYRIVAGERRWRACRMAGLTEAPVIVMNIDEKKAAEIALIENIQRKDLNILEEAAAYKALLTEYDLTQEEVSSRLGISRSALANTIRLLDLPKDIAALLLEGKITAGHARAILSLSCEEDMQTAADEILEQSLNVRQTEALVRKLQYRRDNPSIVEPPQPPKVDYNAELSTILTSRLGRRVKVVNRPRCRRLEIEFADNDDLEKLLASLSIRNPFDIEGEDDGL